MKKSAGMLCVALSLFISACTTYNDSEFADGVFIGYSKLLGNCYIGAVERHREDGREIVLPSTYNGYRINELGGYFGTGYPTPFCVSLEGEEWFASAVGEKYHTFEEYLYTDFFQDKEVLVEDVFFRITLPSGLERVENLACDYITYGETATSIYVLRPVYYFEIATENEYFYTENGVLYEKKTEKKIEGITYTPYSEA